MSTSSSTTAYRVGSRPTKAQIAQGIKCVDCTNPVRSNGFHAPHGPICGKCLTTPPEIRSREIHGCMSLGFIAAYPAEKAKADRLAHREYMSHAGASTHRKRFRLAMKAPE